MFEPVSRIAYTTLNPDLQLLVCTCEKPPDDPETVKKWRDQAAATFRFTCVLDVVRDILANPQIRALALTEEEGPGVDALLAFWNRKVDTSSWGIRADHLELVRQFVDLFDEDCGFRKSLQPFWPERLRYVEGSTWKR